MVHDKHKISINKKIKTHYQGKRQSGKQGSGAVLLELRKNNENNQRHPLDMRKARCCQLRIKW